MPWPSRSPGLLEDGSRSNQGRGRGYGSFPSNQGRGMGYGSFWMWQVYRLTHGWCCVKKFAARGVGTWLWRGGNFSQTILVRLRKTFIISFFN